ncbi:MAG TPA: hypothetical protein VGV09_06680 [Steroidobacteraceae bacterium]|nr:hypothetical protein [Steroidobacteraceae bacterium]
MDERLTAAERTLILGRYRAAQDARLLADSGGNDEAADRATAELRRWKTAYFDSLPRVAMSCCPFDGKPLIRSFDPFGYDGLWWDRGAAPEELAPCTHFCLVRGAVNNHGIKPIGGNFEVRPGPEVPYVIPRILQMPGMQAVIGELPMASGLTAYPVAYFAARRPPVQTLTADWPRKLFTFTTDLGVAGYQIPNDTWDFELRPWLEAGKLRWCKPRSDNLLLDEAPWGKCPYLHLQGLRRQFVIKRDKNWTIGLPTGKEIHPSHMD